jgi:hypothetical protein
MNEEGIREDRLEEEREGGRESIVYNNSIV